MNNNSRATRHFEEDAGTLAAVTSSVNLLRSMLMQPLSTELIEQEFYSVFSGKTAAQTHIGMITLEKARTRETPLPLLTSQSWQLKSNTFKFTITEHARIRAEKPAFEPITISYFDTYDWYFTNQLIRVYNDQFDHSSGLLKPTYKSTVWRLRQGQQDRVYTGCSISKPEPSSYSPSADILIFTFELFYSNYDESLHNTYALKSTAK